MSQTIGHWVFVRWEIPDRINPARTDKDIRRIVELLPEARHLWEDAVDGGVYSPKTDIGGTRHTGFDDNDPTHSAATRPTQRQLRETARAAATLIAEARQNLDDAVRTLHNGLLRTDPEVLAEHLEKRRAATQKR